LTEVFSLTSLGNKSGLSLEKFLVIPSGPLSALQHQNHVLGNLW